jgi:Resolvase, N terminal domain
MASQPAALWGRLPDDLKQAIVSDLKTIVSEVSHGHHSSGPTPSSQAQSRDVHSSIPRAPGAHQHREPTAPTRHAGAAHHLGWPDERIEVVETDWGRTAQSTERRDGSKALLAEVALGQVGIVLSYESTRLSRNCTDWYPLLDLCA